MESSHNWKLKDVFCIELIRDAVCSVFLFLLCCPSACPSCYVALHKQRMCFSLVVTDGLLVLLELLVMSTSSVFVCDVFHGSAAVKYIDYI